LLSQSDLGTAELVQPVVAMVGVLALLLWPALDGLPAMVAASAGATLVGYGWWSERMFSRAPAVFSAVTAVVFFACVVFSGLAASVAVDALHMRWWWPGVNRFGGSLVNLVMLVFGALCVLSARGISTGLTMQRLHRVERPLAPVVEGYR